MSERFKVIGFQLIGGLSINFANSKWVSAGVAITIASDFSFISMRLSKKFNSESSISFFRQKLLKVHLTQIKLSHGSFPNFITYKSNFHIYIKILTSSIK